MTSSHSQVIALPVPVFVENFQRLWDAHYLTEHVKQRRKEKERRDALNMHGVGFNAAAVKMATAFSLDGVRLSMLHSKLALIL